MFYHKVSLEISWVLVLIFSSFHLVNANIANLKSVNAFTYGREKLVKRLFDFDVSFTNSAPNDSTKILDRVCQKDLDCDSGVGTNTSSILGNYACVDSKCKYVVAAGEQCNVDSDCAASLYYIRDNSSLCSPKNCNLNSKCSSAWDPQIFNSPSPNFSGFMCCGGIKENDECLWVATNVDPCDQNLSCESSVGRSQYTCVSKRNSNVMVGVIICLIGSTVLNVGLNIQKYAFTKHQEKFNEQKLQAESVDEKRTSLVEIVGGTSVGGGRISFVESVGGTSLVESIGRTSFTGSVGETSDNIEHSRFYKKLEKFMFWKQIVVSPLWTIGFLIYIAGTMMGFLALQFAPQSLIAPLGAVSLITNLLIAPILHSQRLTLSDVFGVIIIIGGCAVITIFSGVVFQDYKLCVLIALFQRPSTIIYLSIIASFIVILILFIKLESRNADAPNTLNDLFGSPEVTLIASRTLICPCEGLDKKSGSNLINSMQVTEKKYSIIQEAPEATEITTKKSMEKSERDINRMNKSNRDSVKSNGTILIKRRRFREKFLLPIAYAVLASSMATLTTLFAKSLINLLTQTFIHHDNQFNNLISWIILIVTLVTAVGQVYWLNLGLKKYDALIQVPIFFCNWSIYDIIGGGIYYDEFKSFTTIKYIEFALGVAMIFFGVALLSKRLATLTKEEEELNANQKLIESEMKEMKRKRNKE